MTCCVAAICDDGKSIVMVADRMIGIGIIQSEPDITKLRELHKDWWVLFSGDDISPIFDVMDYARDVIRGKQESEHVGPDTPITLQVAMEAVRESYQRKRMEDAETLHLRPIGWNITSFNSQGQNHLPDFMQIKQKIESHSLPIVLLVAGFSNGKAYLFSLAGYGGKKGITERHDVPGFSCIGSGGLGATYMLYYREMGAKKPLREALYYAMEAKLFGEQASGVGEKTDISIATSDGKFIRLDEKSTIDGTLMKVWNKLRLHWISKESRDLLNSIPELSELPKLEKSEKKEAEKSPASDTAAP